MIRLTVVRLYSMKKIGVKNSNKNKPQQINNKQFHGKRIPNKDIVYNINKRQHKQHDNKNINNMKTD